MHPGWYRCDYALGRNGNREIPYVDLETMAALLMKLKPPRLSCRCGRSQSSRSVFCRSRGSRSVNYRADLKATAIVAPTVSGETARTIARFRPHCPIVAVTPSPITQRRLALVWGVYSIWRPDRNPRPGPQRGSRGCQRHGYVDEAISSSSPAVR